MITLLVLGACKKDPDPVVEPTTPGLEVLVPPRAACVPPGEARVMGQAPGLHDLTINGAPLGSAYGQFDGTVDLPRGVTLLEVRGTDANDHQLFDRRSVLAGEFAEPEGSVPGAIEVRLNESGLAQVGDLLADFLNPDELFTSLSATSPLYNYYSASWLPGTDDMDVDFYLTALDFRPLEVVADTSNDRLHLDLRLPSLYVEIETWGTITFLNNAEGDLLTITADEVHLAADVTLDVGPDGVVTAGITGVVAELPGFDATWEYLWGVVDWAADTFVDIGDLIADALAGALVDLGEPVLGSAFSAMSTSFELELLGKPMSLDLLLVDIRADANGILLSMDLGADVPPTVASEVPGYLWAPPVEPAPDPFAPVSMALSDNLVNRVLHEAWAGGMIELTLSTDDGSLDPFMLEALGASAGTITVSSRLPPVVVEQGGALVAQMGEVDVRLETPGGENGEWIELTMYASTALDLGVTDNALTIGLGAPDVRFVVRDSDWGISNETITRLFEDQLPIDVLLLLLGEFSFPLPEIAGLTIGSATVSRDASGSHTDVVLSLE